MAPRSETPQPLTKYLNQKPTRKTHSILKFENQLLRKFQQSNSLPLHLMKILLLMTM